MNKTQGAVLKQRISKSVGAGSPKPQKAVRKTDCGGNSETSSWLPLSLFSLFLLLRLAPNSFAYSSLVPFENESGPARGLTFSPTVGFLSRDQKEGELNATLSAALNPDLSAYGRASLSNSNLLGLSARILKSSELRWLIQAEGFLDEYSHAGLSAGTFATLPLFKNFELEGGIALTYAPSSETSTLPVSLLLNRTRKTPSWTYGGGLVGEASPSNNLSWYALKLQTGYETAKQLYYGASLALPLSSTNSQNGVAFAAHLEIPLGLPSKAEQDSTYTPPSEMSAPISHSLSSSSNFASADAANGRTAQRAQHYDLNAEITSINDSLYLLKIDKGSSDSIEKGQTFDVYCGENLIASAQVVSVKKDEAALSVIEYLQEQWIDLGFTARRKQAVADK